MKKFFKRFSAGLTMFIESVRMSVSNICHNRMRSFLTILGIMIGVTAVIALITTISAVSATISDSFTSMGAGTMTLSAPGSDLKAGLSADDLETLTALEHVEGVSPTVTLNVTAAQSNAYESSVSVGGRNAYYFTANDGLIARGRAITPLDVNQSSRVCLISSDLVETFFYGADPIGETLYLNGRSFTVIGILTDDGDSSISGMMSGSSDVLIPYTTALKMNGESLVTNLTIYIDSAESSSLVETELEPVLDALFSYEDDTYTITTMDAIEDTMSSMLSMMSMLLGGIASIALLVGGIGIMNMMLTSVTERTVEIGLKKAIGAEPGADSAAISDRVLSALHGGRHDWCAAGYCSFGDSLLGHGHGLLPFLQCDCPRCGLLRRRRHHFRLVSRTQSQQAKPHRRSTEDVRT